MPRLVDWGARYEFIREAVVRVAARRGAAAVTLEGVAAELHVSTSTLRRALESPDTLPGMGVRWIARQRHYRRYLRGLPPGADRGSVEHAVWLLRSELPEVEEELEQERAWSQLVHGGVGEDIRELQQAEDAYVDALVRSVLELRQTEQSTREGQAITVRAVLDGLKAALCRQSITVDAAVQCLDTCLATLSPDDAGSPR